MVTETAVEPYQAAKIDTIVGSQLNAFHHLCEINSEIIEQIY